MRKHERMHQLSLKYRFARQAWCTSQQPTILPPSERVLRHCAPAPPPTTTQTSTAAAPLLLFWGIQRTASLPAVAEAQPSGGHGQVGVQPRISQHRQQQQHQPRHDREKNETASRCSSIIQESNENISLLCCYIIVLVLHQLSCTILTLWEIAHWSEQLCVPSFSILLIRKAPIRVEPSDQSEFG